MTQTPDHQIAIIGAGLSGLGAAVTFARSGIDDVVLLERSDDVGGTWRDNTYPGVAVDVPAQAYQFPWALNPAWTRTYATGNEVKDYVDRIALEYDLLRRTQLGTEVTARRWDEGEHLWRLELRNADDTTSTMTARFVVSAIGAFVDPKIPTITGLEEFVGPVVHTARWDHTRDLSGQRVAVIGTGASAVQIVPHLAKIVGQLDVYQRTAIWVGPKRDRAVSPRKRAMFRRIPRVQEALRRISTAQTELMLVGFVVNHYRMPWLSDVMGSLLRRVWYRIQVKDHVLRAQLTPNYGFGCKRPSVSNDYLRTFERANVELVTDPIEAITPGGIRTATGQERPADTLVLATGFHLASEPDCYRRTPVRGRDGFDLATAYETERLSSYEGVSRPGLPNHFTIFGPYGWTGGTWHQLVDTAATHIVRVIAEAERRGATAVEVTPEATQRWTATMQDRMSRSLFQASTCATAHSYYVDHHGDTPYLRPTSSAAAERAARTFPLNDYHYECLGAIDAERHHHALA